MIGSGLIDSHRVVIAYVLLAGMLACICILLHRARRSFAWYRDRITWKRKKSLDEYVRNGKYIWKFSSEKRLPGDYRTGHVHRVPKNRPGLRARDMWPPNNKGFRKFVHGILHLQWYQVKRRRGTGYGWTMHRPRDSSRILRTERSYPIITH